MIFMGYSNNLPQLSAVIFHCTAGKGKTMIVIGNMEDFLEPDNFG